MKKSLGVLLSVSLLLTGCGMTKEEKRAEQVASIMAKREASKINLIPYLDLSKTNVTRSNKLVYAKGAITNNYHKDIDEIADIVFLDENNFPIRVKKMILRVASGQTVYFEELIGLDSEVPKVSVIELADVYDY